MWNIVIGGFAGSAASMAGWATTTNSMDLLGFLVGWIVFMWTPPHFWAYAIAKREDYAKVSIPMLPVTHGIAFTQLHILLYTILLFLVSLLPYATGMSGGLYLLGAVPLGGIFLHYAIRLKRKADPRLAMRTFGYSLVYLVGIFSALLVDHYLIL